MGLFAKIKQFFTVEPKERQSKHTQQTYPMTTLQDEKMSKIKMKMVEKLAKNGYLSKQEHSTLERWRDR